MPLVPFFLLILPCPALLTTSGSQNLQTGGHRAPRDTNPDSSKQPIKVVISEACVQGASDSSQTQDRQLDLEPGSPLVLTHRIRLIPGSCGGGCEAEFAALRDRLERLEKEVSALREKCGGPDGGCCTSQQSKGVGCTIQPECPNECSDQGRCVDGNFMGPDCSARACPKNCSNKGRCVNGKCVCEVGFTGQDCANMACADNCNNKGRCVKGRCVCQRGFAAPDCSQCESGFTGLDCGTAMSGVSELRTKNITDSSVTLFWIPPPVQYDTYHVTFASQKEGDQQITSQVQGRLTAYTQTGLAAGQEYTVTIRGEIDGRMGAESTAEFTTFISGPTNLHVVKKSTTSAVVQWEQALGEIDRYRLTIAPNQTDGTAKGRQELSLPPERNSAQIDGLDPGDLYDITLVAEKGRSKSKPATVPVTPGEFH
ncbi:hypothetical protein UPYG_G00338840 [Umbra pygmaea]|uniref:Fibronectin type-III domain-containing protein n=1 Tax=Umbra pygmaea TaxID=75934 RepID=A0ABD0VY75_UMBPY